MDHPAGPGRGCPEALTTLLAIDCDGCPADGLCCRAEFSWWDPRFSPYFARLDGDLSKRLDLARRTTTRHGHLASTSSGSEYHLLYITITIDSAKSTTMLGSGCPLILDAMTKESLPALLRGRDKSCVISLRLGPSDEQISDFWVPIEYLRKRLAINIARCTPLRLLCIPLWRLAQT